MVNTKVISNMEVLSRQSNTHTTVVKGMPSPIAGAPLRSTTQVRAPSACNNELAAQHGTIRAGGLHHVGARR